MIRCVWPVLLCLSLARVAHAEDVRVLMHHALEAAAPIPTASPSFGSRESRLSMSPRGARHRSAEQNATAAADESVGSAVRDAHAAAASRVAFRSAREEAQSAQTDANGDPVRNRSRLKRGSNSDNGKKGTMGSKK